MHALASQHVVSSLTAAFVAAVTQLAFAHFLVPGLDFSLVPAAHECAAHVALASQHPQSVFPNKNGLLALATYAAVHEWKWQLSRAPG